MMGKSEKDMVNKTNDALLCDFYELTMGNGYYQNGFYRKKTYFDVFFRNVPDNGGFAIAAGLEQVIDYIENLHFTSEDIAFLLSLIHIYMCIRDRRHIHSRSVNILAVQ